MKYTLLPVVLVLIATVFFQEDALAGDRSALPRYDRVRVLQSPHRISDRTLLDQNSDSFDLGQLRGRVTLVFFGFTNCPDVCPMALHKLKRFATNTQFDEAEVAYVMISVDGERDTPAVLKDYLARYSPDFIGLTGESGDVKAAAAEFKAAFFASNATGDSDDYTVSHSPQIFVVDQSGHLRAEFYDARIDAMDGIVTALLAEQPVMQTAE